LSDLSPAPQAVPQAAGFLLDLSSAPQAVPQVAEFSSLQPTMFDNDIIFTSLVF
jgi:hypothetical protein